MPKKKDPTEWPACPSCAGLLTPLSYNPCPWCGEDTGMVAFTPAPSSSISDDIREMLVRAKLEARGKGK